MHIRFQKLRPEAHAPQLAYPGDLGMDIRTPVSLTIPAGGQGLVETGLQIEIPTIPAALAEDFQLGCFVWSKSGLSVRDHIEKGAGVIDPNYTGELKIKLYNHGETDKHFAAGDKVAQLVFQLCAKLSATTEADLSHKESERGSQGFGSSGK